MELRFSVKKADGFASVSVGNWLTINRLYLGAAGELSVQISVALGVCLAASTSEYGSRGACHSEGRDTIDYLTAK